MKKTGHIGSGHLGFPTADQLPHSLCSIFWQIVSMKFRLHNWSIRTLTFKNLLQKSHFHGLAKLFLHVRMATKSMASYIITNLNILLSVSWPELLLYPMKQKKHILTYLRFMLWSQSQQQQLQQVRTKSDLKSLLYVFPNIISQFATCGLKTKVLSKYTLAPAAPSFFTQSM